MSPSARLRELRRSLLPLHLRRQAHQPGAGRPSIALIRTDTRQFADLYQQFLTLCDAPKRVLSNHRRPLYVGGMKPPALALLVASVHAVENRRVHCRAHHRAHRRVHQERS